MTNQIPQDIDNRLARVRSSVLHEVAVTRTHRYSRVARVAIATAAGFSAAAVLTAGALVVAQLNRDEVTYSAECFSALDLASLSTTVTAAEATDNSTGESVPRDTIDPVAACGEMWRMGIIGQPSPPSDPNHASFPVPNLVACTLSNGRGAAFPIGDADPAALCASLGLAVWKA